MTRARQTSFVFPKFSSVQDVETWMDRRIHEKYGGRKIDFISSEEYRMAYPHISLIYSREKEKYIGDLAKAGKKALNEANLKPGDRVTYDTIGSFFNVAHISGKIVMKNGVPYVHLDEKMQNKRTVRWHKGWIRE
jgi:hypothetical protein